MPFARFLTVEETLLWKWEGNRNNLCPCFRLEPVPGMLSRAGSPCYGGIHRKKED